jgi:general secretion pathway protein G
MNTRWSTRRRRRLVGNPGMTLVEIMIVVIIMALIATGVAFAVIPMLGEARVTQTNTDMRVIQGAVTLYMVHHGNCPSSVSDLVEDGRLSRSARTTDAWNNEFQIVCEGDGEPVIVSNGPDGQGGTDDDLRTDSAGEQQQGGQ